MLLRLTHVSEFRSPSAEHSCDDAGVGGSTRGVSTLRRLSDASSTTVCSVLRRGPKRRKKDKRGGYGKPAGKRKTRGMAAEKRRPRNFAALLEEARTSTLAPAVLVTVGIAQLCCLRYCYSGPTLD